MLNIIVWGIPPDLASIDHLEKLVSEQIPQAVAEVLGTTMDRVLVFAPSDLLRNVRGEELIVHINDLPEGRGTTVGFKYGLADAVRRVLATFVGEHVPQCRRIEVRTKSHDKSREGYAVWRRP